MIRLYLTCKSKLNRLWKLFFSNFKLTTLYSSDLLLRFFIPSRLTDYSSIHGLLFIPFPGFGPVKYLWLHFWRNVSNLFDLLSWFSVELQLVGGMNFYDFYQCRLKLEFIFVLVCLDLVFMFFWDFLVCFPCLFVGCFKKLKNLLLTFHKVRWFGFLAGFKLFQYLFLTIEDCLGLLDFNFPV